jgi:hypothetical protein
MTLTMSFFLAMEPANVRYQRSEGAHMQPGSRILPVFCTLLLCCNVFCAGCSALIAYSGEDMDKLGTKEQVHASFGTPCKSGEDHGLQFEEYYTHRKISEPHVAGVDFIMGVESVGLLELWMFPVTVCGYTWTTLVGQDLRVEYASNGEVRRILINGMSMESRAHLP